MDCLFATPTHDGRDILPVRLGLRKDVQLMCSGCRTHIEARAFLRIVERRHSDAPTTVERRKPVWLSRLTSRDMTGLIR